MASGIGAGEALKAGTRKRYSDMLMAQLPLMHSLVFPHERACAGCTSYESTDQQATVALAGAQAIVAISCVGWFGEHGALAVPAVMTSLSSLRGDRHLLLDVYLGDASSALSRRKGIQEARLDGAGFRR
jgi:hypothetical protein